MRSNPEERDSWNVHRARGTASDERDSHPRWCSFPRGLHLRLRWWYISRLQFRATGPNFHTELPPVHSPLLKESYLVSYPPLTYMLKFSGFADLASCREGCARGADQQHGFSSDTQRSWPSKYHHISKLFGCRSNTTVQLRQQKGQREPSPSAWHHARHSLRDGAKKHSAIQLAHHSGHEQRVWMRSRH